MNTLFFGGEAPTLSSDQPNESCIHQRPRVNWSNKNIIQEWQFLPNQCFSEKQATLKTNIIIYIYININLRSFVIAFHHFLSPTIYCPTIPTDCQASKSPTVGVSGPQWRRIDLRWMLGYHIFLPGQLRQPAVYIYIYHIMYELYMTYTIYFAGN